MQKQRPLVSKSLEWVVPLRPEKTGHLNQMEIRIDESLISSREPPLGEGSAIGGVDYDVISLLRKPEPNGWQTFRRSAQHHASRTVARMGAVAVVEQGYKNRRQSAKS